MRISGSIQPQERQTPNAEHWQKSALEVMFREGELCAMSEVSIIMYF
jgi:hypothetical protein